MANPSLAEYVAQSQRGLYQSVFGQGFMKKAHTVMSVLAG